MIHRKLGFSLAILASLLLCASAIIYAAQTSIVLAALVTVFFVVALVIVRPAWRASEGKASHVGLAAVSAVAVIAGYYAAPHPIIDIVNATVIPYLQRSYPGVREIEFESPPFLPLITILLAIAFIVRTASHPTIMTRRKSPDAQTNLGALDSEMSAFGTMWAERLTALDREANWSDRDFVSIDAEVESISLSGTSRRVGDLVEELRRSKSDEPILILGEPGSGKSVALRHLCRLLLDEVKQTHRLPLYVNLKNWSPTNPWTQDTPPSVIDLRNYVLSYIQKEADDLYATRFLHASFDQLLQSGSLFFIFDSFDEIPAIMDTPEHSWISVALSEVIQKFLVASHSSRGIVASRYFKRPSERLAPGSVYRMRPFDDLKIQRVLRTIGARSVEQMAEFFAEHSDLLSAATNPLVANLIAIYVREHSGKWPENKFEVFQSYIASQVKDPHVSARMNELGIDISQCVATTVAIADVMAESERWGLEIPTRALEESLPQLPVGSVVQLLKFARLGRLSSGQVQTFSFVHRRFQEFFVVAGLLSKNVKPDASSIVSDNRYRDTYVLYCEVASSDNANVLAAYCWSRLTKARTNKGESLEAVQALRFLCEAFRSRRQFSDKFLHDLDDYIKAKLNQYSYQPLTAKFACEAIALLNEDRAVEAFARAFSYPSAWIRETAFRACRHLPVVALDVKNAAISLIERYRVNPLLGQTLVRRHREMFFSLSISPAFRSVRTMELAWMTDIFFFPTMLLILMLANPVAGSCVVVSQLMFYRASERSLTGLPEIAARWISIFAAYGLFFALCVVGRGVTDPPGRTQPFEDALLALWTMQGGPDVPSPYVPYFGFVFLLLLLMLPVIPSLVRWRLRDLRRPREQHKRVKARRKTRPSPLGSFWRFLVGIDGNYVTKTFVTAKKPILIGAGLGSAFVASCTIVGFSDTVAYALLAGILVGSGVSAWKGSQTLWKRWVEARVERKYLRSITIDAFVERTDIERALECLKRPKYRLRFVRLLQAKHVVAVGDWTSGTMPFRPNDVACDELLRLEERWLRLDS